MNFIMTVIALALLLFLNTNGLKPEQIYKKQTEKSKLPEVGKHPIFR